VEDFLADVIAGAMGSARDSAQRMDQVCIFTEIFFYSADVVLFRDSSLSRSQVKITGVTISTYNRELTMPAELPPR
jgi:hypothetical protein